jgi:hypothetical protein
MKKGRISDPDSIGSQIWVLKVQQPAQSRRKFEFRYRQIRGKNNDKISVPVPFEEVPVPNNVM